MTVRFGVIGAGRIGKVHAKTIASNPKAKLAYIADALPKAAQDLAAMHGAKVASVDDIMNAKDVDAVLIGSPTGFHAPGRSRLRRRPARRSCARSRCRCR